MSASRSVRAPARAGWRAWLAGLDWRVPAALAATYVLFGSGAAGSKAAIATLPPLGMIGARSVIAGVILFLWARKDGAAIPGRRAWLGAAVVGLLMIATGSGVGAMGQRTVPSGIAGVLSALTPLVAACLGYVLFRETLVRRAVLGLAVGFAGVGLLLRPGADLDPFGLMLLIGGNVSWALGAVLAPRLRLPEDPRMAACAELLSGGTVLLAGAAVLGDFNGFDPAAVTWSSWAGFLWLILVAVGGFTAYGYLAKTVSCSIATTFSYVNPVVAIFLGWLIFGEPVTTLMLVAVAVIVGGVCLIVSTRTQDPCHPPHPLTSGVGHIYIVRGRGKPPLQLEIPIKVVPRP